MLSRLSFLTKGLIIVAVPLVIQLGTVVLFSFFHQSARSNRIKLVNSSRTIGAAHSIGKLIVHAETGIRGMLATGDPTFAKPYEDALEQLPREAAELNELVRGSGNLEVQSARMIDASHQVLEWLASMDRLIRIGRRDDATRPEHLLEGKRRMDEFRSQLDELLRAQESHHEQRLLNLEQSTRDLNSVLIGAAVVSFIVTGALGLAFSLGITNRLKGLIANTRRLAEGHPLKPSGTGSDEIAAVDHAFHELAQKLAASLQSERDKMKLLQSILDGMAEGVMVADGCGQIVLVNPAVQRMHGTEPMNVGPDKWPDRFNLASAADGSRIPAEELPLVRALRGEFVDDYELVIRRPDGTSPTWISVNGRPLRSEADQIVGGVVVIRDVSESKATQLLLRGLNEELERRVASRTRELSDALQELEQKNRENEMFVYSVSHDLRSPLVNLQGFGRELREAATTLQVLLKPAALPDDLRRQIDLTLQKDVGESVQFIQTAVSRLSRIIDALLRLSRVGRVDYRWVKVDLQKVVGRIVEALGDTIRQREAQVTIGSLPSVPGDETALEQVFANLIGNSLNYLAPDRPGRVAVECEVRESEMVVEIRDNGLGISEAGRVKIFQSFQRLHPNVAPGEGMGLTIVRRIVERHRGRIEVDSRVNEGSTFRVVLPMNAEAPLTPSERTTT